MRVFDVPEPVGDRSTVLVFVPRQRFHARLPEQVAALVGEAYGSTPTEIDSFLGSSNLARITFTVTRTTGRRTRPRPRVGAGRRAHHVVDRPAAGRRPIDQLGEAAAPTLLTRIGDDAPESYRSGVLAADAVGDMRAPARAGRRRRRPPARR